MTPGTNFLAWGDWGTLLQIQKIGRNTESGGITLVESFRLCQRKHFFSYPLGEGETDKR